MCVRACARARRTHAYICVVLFGNHCPFYIYLKNTSLVFVKVVYTLYRAVLLNLPNAVTHSVPHVCGGPQP